MLSFLILNNIFFRYQVMKNIKRREAIDINGNILSDNGIKLPNKTVYLLFTIIKRYPIQKLYNIGYKQTKQAKDIHSIHWLQRQR